MNTNTHPRILISGALWSVVYNLIWGVAWFGFMRREWLDAVAAINRPMPWTPQIWAVWAVLTLPIGVAGMAYVASRLGSAPVCRAALIVSSATWGLMTMGMAGWVWHESLAMRVIATDSAVNLVAVVVASLVGEWILRRRHRRGRTVVV